MFTWTIKGSKGQTLSRITERQAIYEDALREASRFIKRGHIVSEIVATDEKTYEEWAFSPQRMRFAERSMKRGTWLSTV